MFDFKQIEAFVWVAELGSFSAAADQLCTTQPAISHRVALLESTLKVKLFERGARGVGLTEPGQTLLTQAQRLLDIRQDMLDMSSNQPQVRGLLRLGVIDTIVYLWLHDFIEVLHRLYPELVVEIHSDTSSALRNQLAQRQIDLAFLAGGAIDPKELQVHLQDHSLVYAASPALGLHQVAHGIADLQDYPIITYPAVSHPYHVLKRALKAAGQKGARVYGCSSLNMIIQMAVRGIGPCVVARQAIAAELAHGSLVTLDIEETLPDIRLYASWMESPGNRNIRHIAWFARQYVMTWGQEPEASDT